MAHVESPTEARLDLEEADPYRLAAEFDAPAKMHGCPRKGHVYHVSLSIRADDRELSGDE